MVILLHTDLVLAPQLMQVVDLILALELAADSSHLCQEQDTSPTLCQLLDSMQHDMVHLAMEQLEMGRHLELEYQAPTAVVADVEPD
eukprot:2063198-Rhodomonas_salina.2